MEIEGQRQRSSGGRRRRRKTKAESKRKQQPDLIVARRPGSPLLMKVKNRNIAASAKPKKPKGTSEVAANEAEDSPQSRAKVANGNGDRMRRTARIAQLSSSTPDDEELRHQRLLERLLCSEGRSAISRIADELFDNQMEVPEEQEVQLQLLEHVHERRARAAIDVLARLLQSQAPIKRPILEQRLRRLEVEADEQETREKAAALRRSLRVA